MSNAGEYQLRLEIDRPLTDEERSLALWMLQNGIPEASDFIPQLEKARVVGECGCGCPTIDFQIDGHEPPNVGLHILGDFMFSSPKDTSGIFIFEQDGILSGLEVVSGGEDLITKLPEIRDLVSGMKGISE